MQRPAGKKASAGNSSSKPQPGKLYNSQKRSSRYLKDGPNVNWLAVSVACGIAIWAINHHYGILDQLLMRVLVAFNISGTRSGSSLRGSLNIHETFGCSNEEEDFSTLMSQLHSAGVNVSNIKLGYKSNGQRGLFAKQDISEGAAILSVPLELCLSVATFFGRAQVQSATKHWWASGLPDVDQLMDPLALVSEALVRGRTSPWAKYFCSLPNTTSSYNIPLSYRDPWSIRLMRHLPGLLRLVNKRSEAMTVYTNLIRETMKIVPAKRHARRIEHQGLLEGTFEWAYAATKTRTVSLDLEEAESAGATLLIRTEEATDLYSKDAGTVTLREERILPSGLRKNMHEMGVMVPVFDMANHASAAQATAAMVVHFKRRDASLYGDQQLTSGQGLSPKAGGVGVEFGLAAVHPIKAGQEITFSYNPDDDQYPICNERWLVEYGFLMDDGRPERHCHSWNLTTKEVLAEAVAIGSTESSFSALSASSSRRLKQKGLQRWVMARLDGSGTVHASMVQWLSVVIGPAPNGFSLPAKAQQQGVEREEAYALGVLCRVIKRQQARVDLVIKEAESDLSKLIHGAGELPAISNAHQSMLLELAYGSVQATKSTMDRLHAFCE